MKPGVFCYELRLQFHNFKVYLSLSPFFLAAHSPEQGFNQGKAGLQNFNLASPELPQHVMFDLPTMMLLYFFYRGVLPLNLRTWDDVLRSEDMEIHVREEVRDEPL